MANIYNSSFYEDQQDGSYISAQRIIPILLKMFHPSSVLDLGCGVGSWLNVFKHEFGVKDILGVDGDYVDKKMLKIEADEFVSHDFKNKYIPLKKYALALSVEAGEHLPVSVANTFIS